MAGSIQVANGVHWVGSLDPDIRVFDLVMRTDHGSSYNAYLVQGSEATALIDMTKRGFESQLLERVSALVDPATIDYVVVNHTEPDHAGAVETVLAAAPKATIVGTRRALDLLGQSLNREFPQRKVRAGDELDLGGRTLRFVPAPFVHWPDTMFTYLPEERVLFSCDVFGSHYCDEALFDDAIDGDFSEAFRYYYEAILSPYAGHVQKALAKIADLAYDVICPSHGPVLRGDAAKYVELYRRWSSGERDGKPRVALCYASIYGFTRKLAEAIGEGLAEGGAAPELVDLGAEDLLDAGRTCWNADAVVLGTPTLNGGPAPQALMLLSLFDPYRAKGKSFAAFGSYGWSGEAVGVLNERATALRMKVLGEGYRAVMNPTDTDLDGARAYGRELAEALL